MHELIQGRVAVIAFWEINCGPCRVEASCLSALYNRYRDKGLAVIAVNDCDGKEDIERFVRSKRLTHPIALMGKKVAQAYTVGSHPVTYLVDHTGAIVDYRLDFDVDAATLARGHVDLVFDGLDTFAEVNLNGKKLVAASLEDFDTHYANVGPSNYAWYQSAFLGQVAKVYDAKKFAFLDEVRTLYPLGSSDEPARIVLQRFERISPGFLTWAEGMKDAQRLERE